MPKNISPQFFENLSLKMENWTPSEIRHLCHETVMIALRHNSDCKQVCFFLLLILEKKRKKDKKKKQKKTVMIGLRNKAKKYIFFEFLLYLCVLFYFFCFRFLFSFSFLFSVVFLMFLFLISLTFLLNMKLDHGN